MEEKLWGWSQVPDAKVIAESFHGTNKKLPDKGCVFEYLPEHYLEIERCKQSIEYFAENYYEIVQSYFDEETQKQFTSRGLMNLWEIQKEALQFFQDNNRVVMNSSRQTSKSTLIRLYILWVLCFKDTKQAIGMLANKYTTAKKSLKELKHAYEALPNFLKPALRQSNESHFELENDNLIRIDATSPDSLRGDTLTALVIDEAAFVNRNGKSGLDAELMQSLLPTLDMAGSGSFCILISTPYGKNNKFAEYFFDSKDGIHKTPFKHFEMLWNDHPDRDETWYEAKIAELGEDQFAVEYGGSFDLGTGNKKIINLDIRDYFDDNTISEPIITMSFDLSEVDDLDDHSFKIWEQPEPDRIYVAGVDVSEGTGNCYSTICVLDVTDLFDIRQVAEYQNNEILTDQFALVCLKVFNMYNSCYAGIEANNVGREIVGPLVKNHKYTNLYRIDINPTKTKDMVKKSQYGWVSHQNNKKKAVGNSRYYLNTRKRKVDDVPVSCVSVRSAALLKEMDSFIPHKGKSNNVNWAAENQYVNDDLVDAFNIALAGLHSDYVEDYFVLDTAMGDKYDPQGKPLKLRRQRNVIQHKSLKSGLNQMDSLIPVFHIDNLLDPKAFVVADDTSWMRNF